MKRSLLFSAAALVLSQSLLADGDYKKPVAANIDFFPKFETIKPPILMPQNAKIEFSKQGHFLVNGEPRYLEGTIFYEGMSAEIEIPTYGYPPALNWIYESTQDYKDLQRIGFDTVGIGVPCNWIGKYRGKYQFINVQDKEKMFVRHAKSGLPIYVDYTAAEWSHGGMQYVEGKLPEKEAFTVRGWSYHWMPYSVNTPQGRELWREMWECGVAYVKKYDIQPFMYELFNEPDYDDLSEFNRNLFVKKTAKKYGGKIARLNADWGSNYADFAEIGKFRNYDENAGLFIEWIKFMEDSFADVCKFGAKVIRKADGRPEAGICFQPLAQDSTNVNVYKTNKNLNAICTPTGGGAHFMGRFLKAMADGKPIFDGETYMGHTRESFRDKILYQYMIGYNAFYTFKWSRRPHDPAWKLENGGVRLGEKFTYELLNPYSIPPSALEGYMDAKKIIFGVNDLFTPRDRGVKSDVAVVYSYPTNRLQRFRNSPITQRDMEKKFAEALEFSQIQYDIVFEEQLKGGRHNRYKAVVAAGAPSYKSTPRRLAEFAEKGGTLVLLYDALTLDEYGKPKDDTITGIKFGEDKSGVSGELKIGDCTMKAFHFKSVEMPDGWRAIGSIDGDPAVWEKSHGKGRFVFVNAKVSGADLRRLAREILKTDKIGSLAKVENAITGESCSAIEMHKAKNGTKVGYIMFNKSQAAEAVAFEPSEDLVFAELVSRTVVEKNSDGKILLPLKAGEPAVFVGDTRENIEKAFGGFKKLSAADAKKSVDDWDRSERLKKMKSNKAFDVPSANLQTVRLHEIANLSTAAQLPCRDGSASALKSAPWTVENCNGIPFDFIRPDHNKNMTFVALGDFGKNGKIERVDGMKIDSKAAALYFLHASCGKSDGEIMRYVVNYSDGSKVEVPMVLNRNIGAWDAVLSPDKNAETVAGYIDPTNRGLYIYKWINPYPYKLIKSLDAVLSNPAANYVATGITLETPHGDSDYDFTAVDKNPKVVFRNTSPASKHEGGRIEVPADGTALYSNFTLNLDKKYSLPANAPEGSISFRIDVGENAKPPAVLRVALGQTVSSVPSFALGSEMFMDLGGGKYSVRVPLSLLLENEHAEFDAVTVQFAWKVEGFETVKFDEFGIVGYRSKNPFRLDSFKMSQWGGVIFSKGADYVALDVDAKTLNWAIGTLSFMRPVPLSENARDRNFVFEVNGGRDILGNRNLGGQAFQMTITYKTADGKSVNSSQIVLFKDMIAGGAVDNIPATWQKVSIPMKRLLPKGDIKEIRSFALQFRPFAADRSGVFLRNFAIE